MNATNKIIELLTNVKEPLKLSTPDDTRGADFTAEINHPYVVFEVGESKSSVKVDLLAIEAVYGFLFGQKVLGNCSFEIGSSTNPGEAGPLCQLARSYSGGTRSINYVLPLMAEAKIVKLDGSRPNKVSLL